MLELRPANTRGYADHDWLKSWHSFSFADYYDSAHMHFASLRVINEDFIAPGGGFPMHPHRNMEIITYLIEGALAHRDSMGNASIIHAGDVQRMSAGRGVLHSEFNAAQQTTHLLQIWIQPANSGGAPSYEQKAFTVADKHNRFCLLASREGREDSLRINQDVSLYASVLDADAHLEYVLAPMRCAYIFLVQGALTIGEVHLQTGDGLKITDEYDLLLTADAESELLLFDLKKF